MHNKKSGRNYMTSLTTRHRQICLCFCKYTLMLKTYIFSIMALSYEVSSYFLRLSTHICRMCNQHKENKDTIRLRNKCQQISYFIYLFITSLECSSVNVYVLGILRIYTHINGEAKAKSVFY